jgi:multiple sugar transport system substrate-binding protein
MTRNRISHDRSGRITRRRVVQGVAAAGAFGLAGCLGGDDEGTDPEDIEEGDLEGTELSVTGWATDDTEYQLLQEQIELFEEEYGADVDYEPIPSEYERQVQTQIGSGEIADVFYLDAEYYASFASEGVLVDLEQYIEEDDDLDIDDFFDPLIEAFTYDDTLYGIPKDFSTLGLFYNEPMLENAGVDEPPETWDELREALEAVQDEGDVDYPMFESDDGRMFFPLLFQKGGHVLSDDGEECIVASEEGVEALEFIVDLLDDDLIGRPSETGYEWHGEAIGSEGVAMAVEGTWAIASLESEFSDVDEDIDVAHMPIPEDGEQATAAYTVCYSSSEHTEDTGAAYTLISELTDSEGMQAWAEQGLALSAHEDHEDLEYYEDNPRRQTMLEAGDWAEVINFGPHSGEIMNILVPELEGAITGQNDPQTALERAQEQINDDVL